MSEMTRLISKDRIPFYNLIEEPEVWIPNYLKMIDAESEYKKLAAEYEQVREAPRSKTDQIKIYKRAYDEHIKKIGNELAAALAVTGADAFRALSRSNDNPAKCYIPREIFEAALEQLPPDEPTVLTDEQKKKKLDSIQEKMNKEKAKIKKFTPQSYLQLKNGNVQCDSRREFHQYWKNIQNRVSGGCNPQGVAIEQCSKNQQLAYEKLGIAKYISPKSTKLPFK